MKDKLIEAIREVFISDKTYTEYVEALADHLSTKGYRKIYDDHQRQCTCYALGCQMAESLKSEVAREIFEEIENVINDELQNNYKVLPHFEFSNELWNKMSGRIEALKEICDFIAELKKKYIGKDTNVTTKESEKDNG